jgi:hypothetical protein
VSSVSDRLQIKPGQAVAVLRQPSDVDLELPRRGGTTTSIDDADAVIVFVRDRDEFESHAGPALAAADRDALASIAYPKAGQLETDLNRDLLAAAARERGARPVRQISIDDVWSALRFRPG